MLIKLHDDINNQYNQYYTENTNILNTQIKNTYFNLKILQTDFVPIDKNVLVKTYTFTNENQIDLDINFLLHSKLLSNDNNFIGAKVIQNGIMQYSHDYTFTILSKSHKITTHQINNTKHNIYTGEINDKDYIGMSHDSSINYEIGKLKPNETKTIEIMIHINQNNTKHKLDEIEEQLNNISQIDIKKELQQTQKYWERYVKEHTKIELKEETQYNKKVKKIYTRTILLYPLLTNEQTGGIGAAIEIDENLQKCGRYAYCWPRDAVFITKALDMLGMQEQTEKFYKQFCQNTQSKNGMWEQRFYTDTRLAPCWGYQIDETASVIYGIYEHYKFTKNIKFLKENLKMMEKAIKYLQKYITLVIEKKEEIQKSYDLWEMHEGIHLYSLASIFSAYECMIKTYQIFEQEQDTSAKLKQQAIQKQKEILQKQQLKIKEYIIQNMYDETKKSYTRGVEDKTIDISILGAVTPFEIFTPKEKRITNTIEKIDLTLRTYTGGYQRFEQDHYMNGNPWPIATLWMGLYHLEQNNKEKAKECLDFVINSASQHGFLAEQIDNNTMQPAWVIGLGWSHAMFIILLNQMFN
ncbi:MAG: hypothetical protein HFJ53_03825 [Clostridia bacterium]|jgi:glucoamylase|nr:hypothetical protein [Clostridia bacterium]